MGGAPDHWFTEGAQRGEEEEAQGSVASFAAHELPVMNVLTWQAVFQDTISQNSGSNADKMSAFIFHSTTI